MLSDHLLEELGLTLQYTIKTPAGEQYRVFSEYFNHIEVGDILSVLDDGDIIGKINRVKEQTPLYGEYRQELFMVLWGKDESSMLCAGWVRDSDGHTVFDGSYNGDESWFTPMCNFDRFCRSITYSSTPFFYTAIGINADTVKVAALLAKETKLYFDTFNATAKMITDARMDEFNAVAEFYMKEYNINEG